MAEYISFQPSDVFSTFIYTGDGSARSFTNPGFQVDLQWTKRRDTTSNHVLSNSISGAAKNTYPDLPDSEASDSGGISSFDANGYSTSTSTNWNGNGGTYVSWNWKAGTTSGLSGGTITPSSYSINTTSGFGMYKYTGTGSAGTIAHGLGKKPGLVIIKCLDASGAWTVWNEGMGGTQYMVLDSLAAVSTNSAVYAAEPTDTVISIGNAGGVNGSPNIFIAYVFAPIKGYSKFGSWYSNNNNSGPFVYTGFRPSWTMIKDTGSNPWVVDDVKREPVNEMEKPLKPASNDGTYTGTAYGIDFLSNGFKIQNNDSTYNGSGKWHIYAAFADFPLVSSNDIPTVAK